MKLSFEPIELTDKILSQGSPTPIEVKIIGKNKKLDEQYAYKIREKLAQIPYLRDVQLGQPIRYPAIDIIMNRDRAAQLGVDASDVSRSLVASTSSSRYTEKNVWIDEKIGVSYNVQVQIPENKMTSLNDISEIPVLQNTDRPVLGDVATIRQDTTYGEDDDIGAVPEMSVTANLHKMDLGTASTDVQRAVASLGTLPRGLSIETRGLTQVLTETLSSLQTGLLTAVIVIFLMLAANFQSFKVSFAGALHDSCRAGGILSDAEANGCDLKPAILYGNDHECGSLYRLFGAADHQRRTLADAQRRCNGIGQRVGCFAHSAQY